MIVNTVGPTNAKIFLVGEAPGRDEDESGLPFQGYAGRTLNWLCSQAGINRPECLIGNVCRQRPPANKISYYFEDKGKQIPKPQLQQWINQLKDEIEKYKPNIVVALGATALWALTGETKIKSYRGYIMESTLVPGQKVIATYHPQAVNYNWKLHFETILDLRKAKFHSRSPSLPKDKALFIDNASYYQFISYCMEVLNCKDSSMDLIAFDIETVQPNSHISIIGFSHSPNFGISIRLLNGHYPVFSQLNEKEIWHWVARVLAEKKIIIHNASYDLTVSLLNNNIHINNLWMDTLIAMHCCFPESPRDLGFCSSILLDVPAWKLTARDNESLYNAKDCARTYEIALQLNNKIDQFKVRKTFEFEMSQLPLAIMLQLQGVKVDQEKRNEIVIEAKEKYEEAVNKLESIIGYAINVKSPKQIKQLLYTDLNLPLQFKRRKSVNDPKILSTDKEALNKLKKLVPDNPVFDLFLTAKKQLDLLKFTGYKFTKGSIYETIFLSPDEKVHTSYNITGAKVTNNKGVEEDEGRKSFGRWSSSKSIILPYGSGNLQNIPSRVRDMYTAPTGYVYIMADYVQAEAVNVAYLINDQKAKTVFKNRRLASYEEKELFDIHRMTAAMMFGKKIEEVTKDMRRIGKTLRHAGNYDAGSAAISATLGCTIKEAAKLKEIYHRTTPQLRVWYKSIQDQLQNTRMLVNCFGRVHRFLDRWSDDLFRSAYAYIPQSTVGDMMNLSLVKLYNNYGDWIHQVLQLHDGIYCLIKEEDIEKAINTMKKEMVFPLEVNHDEMIIEVDFKVGSSWGQVKDFNDEKMEFVEEKN